MAKLDDFLGKKKETAPILDLSKATVKTKEEFKKLFDKVPDFKIKPEKVRMEDIKIREKDFKFKAGKKDLRVMKEPYTFMDPLPPDMKNLKLEDLAPVPIDWKMLTSVRPKSKVDEEMFSRLVELGKLQLKTVAKDKRSDAMDPLIRKTKNKAGVVEMRPIFCKECGEDFCSGKACTLFSYECFARLPDSPTKVPSQTIVSEASKDQKKAKKKIKRKTRKKKKKRSKSKSPSKDVTEK